MNDEKLTITFPDGTKTEIKKETYASDLLNHFKDRPEEILAVKLNNKIYSLDQKLKYSAKIEPVYLNSKDGADVYRRSLRFLLASAAHALFPEARLVVGHSLGNGYYYTIETSKKITEKDISAIQEKMKQMVQQNIPIETEMLSYEEAAAHFEKMGLVKTRKQLNYIAPPRVTVNTINGFSDLYFGPLVLSTGVLKVFALHPYGNGFLLRFPTLQDHSLLPEFKDEPKLFEIFSKYKDWGKRIGVTAAADLNELVTKRKVNDFIDITETFQEKNIAEIADQIVQKKTVRVVLIAGPSSSGKTTTSKKLALELQAMGYTPKVISLDCYYVDHSLTPLDENGNPDYECLEALDVDLLNQNLVDLFAGKEVIIPSYDFHEGKPSFEEKNKMTLGENEILIMEGIHGLNPRLTPKIKDELKFKIYLSALTQLNLDDHNHIPTSDNRLIRRIVRDYQFRGKSAAGTIAMWPSVQKGERLHIFPFQNNADAILNTALDYELSVLKVYAEPLLRCVTPMQPEYAEACQLLSFLNNFASIAPTQVPVRSIIREFIGGSAFHY